MPINCYSNVFCLGATPLPSPTPTETPAPTLTPPPTETPFIFESDYILLTYEFSLPGTDLDTRTRIVVPDIGQNNQSSYLGWGLQSSVGNILIWGGDNTGVGFESVLVNLQELKNSYPSSTELVVDLRSFWFNTIGDQPVIVAATLWKGGSPIYQGSSGDPKYSFTNPTADSTFNISSAGKIITYKQQSSNNSGIRVATFTYNLYTNQGVFNSDDNVTPSV